MTNGMSKNDFNLNSFSEPNFKRHEVIYHRF